MEMTTTSMLRWTTSPMAMMMIAEGVPGGDGWTLKAMMTKTNTATSQMIGVGAAAGGIVATATDVPLARTVVDVPTRRRLPGGDDNNKLL